MDNKNVKLLVTIFSEMYGVRRKYDAMLRPFADVGISIEITDLSLIRPKFIKYFAALFKGLYVPLNCDIAIVRYTFADPVLILLILTRWFLDKKTVFELHSNHVDEFKMRGVIGLIFSLVERVNSIFLSRFVHGIISVSKSVDAAARKNFPYCRKYSIIENGVEVNYLLRDGVNTTFRNENISKIKWKIIFVAANYSPWHGLERFLDSIELQSDNVRANFTITVVGKTCGRNRKRMELLGVKYFDCVPREELLKMVIDASICVDSLNLRAIGLNTSSSLKSREYIAYGKPILASAIACDDWAKYTYIPNNQLIDFQALTEWLDSLKGSEKEMVQQGEYIYKSKLAWAVVAKKYWAAIM